MKTILAHANLLSVGQLPKQRGEAETPTFNQPPHVNRGRHEAKPACTLGPGATVGVLGAGVPRLACLRPTAWLHQRPRTAHREGPSLARRTTQGLHGSGLTRLAREGRRDQGKGTSRGSNDVSHDDQDQAGEGVLD